LPRILCWFGRVRTKASRVPNGETLSKMRLLLLEEGHCFPRSGAVVLQTGIRARPRELLDGSSLSTLVQMVQRRHRRHLDFRKWRSRWETRSAPVFRRAVRESKNRRETIGMIWRKTSPLANQLLQISEVVRRSAAALRKQAGAGRVPQALRPVAGKPGPPATAEVDPAMVQSFWDCCAPPRSANLR